MYGYIRPMQSELLVCEFERYKACYCGLCRAIGKGFGQAARFTLSYEMVFLAMLMWRVDESAAIIGGRCIAGLYRQMFYCKRNATLDICAGYTVILAWWKLRDSIADEPFFKSVPYRLSSLILLRAYKRAARYFPEFDAKAREELSSLGEYEAGGKCSLDGAADKFARLLTGVVRDSMPDELRRPMTELLYHMGRWIYILDAFDDYKDDAGAGRFNAVAARFAECGGALPEEAAARLKTTLTHSNNLVCSAFELLPETTWSQLVSNTIYLGMPDVCSRVMDGSWQSGRKARGVKCVMKR